MADVLPHCPADLPVIIFTVNGKDNASRDFVVRKRKVSDALHWLVRNNPLYTKVRIDYNQIEKLPEHGKLEDVTRLDFNSLENEKVKGGTRSDATRVNKSSDDHSDATVDNDDHGGDNGDSSDDDSDDHGNIGIDRGPVDPQGDAEVVYDENAEMTSFMPTPVNQKKETDLISQKIQPDQPKHPWKIDSDPFNEYSTEFLATLSFPSLFPDGKGDPMNHALVRNISENETESFAQKIKHLIKFAENINGKWKYHFASHTRFAYWAYNILYRRRLLNQGNFFIKQNPGEANLTLEELHEMISSGSYSKVMSKLMHYAKNVTGTNAYWNQTKEQLKATITQLGAPTIFWTLSCADFHWPEFHTLFSTDTDSAQLRSNVINNPHIID